LIHAKVRSTTQRCFPSACCWRCRAKFQRDPLPHLRGRCHALSHVCTFQSSNCASPE
jgi:hypothetical protein